MAGPPMATQPLDIIVAYDFGHVNGGAAKVAIAGAIGLRARGHRVRFFAPVGPADPKLSAAGVETIILDQQEIAADPNRPAAALNGLWNRTAAKQLAKLLADVDPARGVIYQHGWSKAMSPASQAAIAASGVPSVYHMHEFFAACPNGAFYDYPKARNCDARPMSLDCISRNCDARSYSQKLYRVLRHGLLAWPGDFASNLTDVIHLGDRQYRIMAPWLPKTVRSVYAPNPIEVTDLGPAAGPGASVDTAPFLFVGRLSREKGADIAMAAAALAEAPIAFIGDGELSDTLRQAGGGADFQGWLPPDAVGPAMRQARALVFPSIWHECQPLTVLEALAHGLPVLTSATSAGAELVADDVTGLHVKTGSVEAMAAAMREMMAGDRAQRMGQAAHAKYWQTPHTLDRHLDAVEPFLRQAVARRNE